MTRLERIHAAIATLDYICSGSLQRRMKICGNPICACRRDRAARHGPYFEWSRYQGKRQVSTQVPAHFAARLKRALANNRRLRRLLTRWERESVRILQRAPAPTPKKR